MTSTEAGRNVITETSKSLKDDLQHGLRDADIIYNNLSEKIVIIEEELDGIDIDHIGNLQDLLRQVLIN